MNTVYIVHCVDTEGPLAEQPMGLDYKPPQAISEDFGAGLQQTTTAHRSRLLGRWEDIMEMVKRATSPEFRKGWVYNWFCMDHLNFIDNPRGRAMGMHAIFDVYRRIVSEQKAGDAIHWHFHPMSTYREAHRCATSYINSPELWEILCRRLIERKWFPVANRSGFQDQRPDSHWFLEQFIPFDFSNLAGAAIDSTTNADLAEGRFNDWRGAPDDWSTYHPSHDDYRKPGQCRRKIARCLNVLNRFANLDQAELDKAFARAADGRDILVAFASHDWRDLTTEVNYVRALIERAQARHPNVSVRIGEAVEAFNAVHPEPPIEPLKLIAYYEGGASHPSPVIRIFADRGAVFGPQPFFAVKTRSGRFIHDNLNRGERPGLWWYAFDENSIHSDDVAEWGVAANDAEGHQSIITQNANAISQTSDGSAVN
jgi:hypothetical protein